MKAKSEKRLLAEQLRLDHGLSYNEISEQTGVSKSTLSNWLKHISLTIEQEERIQQRLENNQAAFVATARKINQKRFQEARERAFQSGMEIASHIPNNDAVRELALAMLYLGEGDKTGNRVQIANVDLTILQYFLWAMEKLYQINRSAMSLRLNIIEAARASELELIAWWAEQLSCSPGQFQKTQFEQRSRHNKVTGNYRGVCTITYNDTYLFKRLTGVYSAYLEKA